MSITRYIFFILFFVAAFATKQFAQDITLKVTIDSSKIRIGEQTKLDIYVSYNSQQKNMAIQWPEINDTLLSKVDVVSQTVIDTTIPDKNNPSIIQQHVQLTITSFDSGFYAIPPFKFIINNDTAHPQLTDPLLLEVHTVPTDTSDASIKDIHPPFQEPFNWKWYLPYAYWTLGILAIVGIIIFVIYRLTKNKKQPIYIAPKPTVPPHIIALEELEKIKANQIWKDNKIKEYYSAITDVIRAYIEGRFNINALELTSDEIIYMFRTQVIDSVSKEKLHQLLQLSDLVKFAKQVPIEQEHTLALQHAFDFVNGTKREEQISKVVSS